MDGGETTGVMRGLIRKYGDNHTKKIVNFPDQFIILQFLS